MTTLLEPTTLDPALETDHVWLPADPDAIVSDAPPLAPGEAIALLREYSHANRAQPLMAHSAQPISLVDDMANGTLHMCSQGNGIALAFYGSPDFITRWFNWAVNTAVIGRSAQLNWFLEKQTGRLAYICPKTREDVMRGLALQFRWEIIRDREIPLLTEGTHTETEEPLTEFADARIDALAAARAEQFMKDHIKVDSTILQRPRNIAPIYGRSGPGRAESNWATGTED